MADEHERLHAGALDELRERGVIVVAGGDRPIAVFLHDGDQVAAVDNRCPHLGFPLHKGTVKDGLLTCHWHEARFDLCSGCTFDLWADDVPIFETEVRDGNVYVSPRPKRAEDADHYRRRLVYGLQHGVGLIQAKAILGLRRKGFEWIDVLREVASFGTQHHDDWSEGMTLLTIAANLRAHLSEETMYHVALRASRQVAADCSDAVPTRKREPLLEGDPAPERLSRWLCNWVQTRHRDGAERVVLTACDRFGPSAELADIVFTAANERVYAQIGHVFDASNKAFELLDAIGWEQAADMLPLLMRQTVMAPGAEEDAHWHHPVEVIEPLKNAEATLREMFAADFGRRETFDAHLTDVLLGDDPLSIIDALMSSLREGAAPHTLAKQVAYAAAVRLARFAMTNEVTDWFNPRHTFIFANAVHRAVKRSPTPGVVRGILHAALSVYMDRFLNMPAARMPGDERLGQLPTDSTALRRQLLDALDTHADVETTAAMVVRHLRQGHPRSDLIDVLAFATSREDLDFHAMQVLEAAVQQCREWDGGPETEQIFVAVARQLAAFCPTPRAGLQIARIADRLDRGEKMYEGDAPV
ncbi:MAG: Rieske (2Fe-2S) protein [Planctomycetaceae bacterium]